MRNSVPNFGTYCICLKEMGNKGSELTFYERMRIEAYLRAGHSPAAIARYMDRHRTTIYKEIRRGIYYHRTSDWSEEERYSADLAQSKYEINVRNRGTDIKIGKDHKYAEYLEKKVVDQNFSPAAAINQLRANGQEDQYETRICVKTFYNYIKRGIFLRLTQADLPQRGTRKTKHRRIKRQKKLSAGQTIDVRPEHIKNRKEFGHWEMDTVKGKQGVSKCSLLVLTERKTRKELIFKLPDGTAQSVCAVLDDLEQKWKSTFGTIFKSITVDNGTEFSLAERMEQSCLRSGRRTELYYCHAYSSWERGSNENCNKLIRRHIPKGSNFDRTPPEEIKRIEEWINYYPRRIHGYRCAESLYLEELRTLGITVP